MRCYFFLLILLVGCNSLDNFTDFEFEKLEFNNGTLDTTIRINKDFDLKTCIVKMVDFNDKDYHLTQEQQEIVDSKCKGVFTKNDEVEFNLHFPDFQFENGIVEIRLVENSRDPDFIIGKKSIKSQYSKAYE